MFLTFIQFYMQNQRLQQMKNSKPCGFSICFGTFFTYVDACKLGPANFFHHRLTEISWSSMKGNVKSCVKEPIHAVDSLAEKQLFRKGSRGSSS